MTIEQGGILLKLGINRDTADVLYYAMSVMWALKNKEKFEMPTEEYEKLKAECLK